MMIWFGMGTFIFLYSLDFQDTSQSSGITTQTKSNTVVQCPPNSYRQNLAGTYTPIFSPRM